MLKKDLRATCRKEFAAEAALAASGVLSAQELAEFGLELLKATLFHEVGHAMGLGHNFKGSLAYDASKPRKERVFSSSIMDYNHFESERQAFESLESSNGVLLEYDRQAISALYNAGADIEESAPVLPACADREADREAGGVDPLCIRYDSQSDPTLSIATAFNRIEKDALKDDVTLSQALDRAMEAAIPVGKDLDIPDEQALARTVGSFFGGIRSSLQYFYTTGRASVSASIRLNLKSLLMFSDGAVKDPAQQQAMRERTFGDFKKP